jgi:diguanylate cyclase (GGDEF)-like protein
MPRTRSGHARAKPAGGARAKSLAKRSRPKSSPELAAPRMRPPRVPRTARRHGAAELAVLYETIRDLTGTLAVHEVIERLLERILLHLESEIGSVLLFDDIEGKLRILLARGLPEPVVRETRIRPGEGISGYVFVTGKPLLVADVERDRRFRRRNHERYYTRSCISAPLIIGGVPRGVIHVNNKSSRMAFDRQDLRLLEAIAGHAAAALGNAQRFEEMLGRAQRDALTGLANQGYFWEFLESEVRRAQRYARPLAVVMIDVDRFKAYNDRHGHLAGDKALVALARALLAGSRSHDLVARYGGEEFAVLLPETTRDGATRFAENMRERIQAARIGAQLGSALTVSIGVATFPGDGERARDLVAVADRELYRAKAAGRNRVSAAAPR